MHFTIFAKVKLSEKLNFKFISFQIKSSPSRSPGVTLLLFSLRSASVVIDCSFRPWLLPSVLLVGTLAYIYSIVFSFPFVSLTFYGRFISIKAWIDNFRLNFNSF